MLAFLTVRYADHNFSAHRLRLARGFPEVGSRSLLGRVDVVGQQVALAQGGQGGRGNSKARPHDADRGAPGEEVTGDGWPMWASVVNPGQGHRHKRLEDSSSYTSSAS